MPSLKDHTGKRFGRLKALERVRTGKLWSYRCECDCGSEVVVLSGNLTRNSKPTRSCGCLAAERASLQKGTDSPTYRHGHGARGGSTTHRIWRGMKDRCQNPNNPDYPYYGGRGVTMCERWAASFEEFLSDMGERPKGMTIERVNNERGYEPGNCVWASRSAQSRNTRRNKTLVVDGTKMCAMDASDHTGVNYSTLVNRLDRGVSVGSATRNRRMRRGER